jgi:hypothetical protein
MLGIKLLLQNGKTNEAQNILIFLVRRAGAKMRFVGRRYRKKEHWFDEECMDKRREMKEALRKFKGKTMTKAELSIGKTERHTKKWSRERGVYGMRKKQSILIS